MLPGGGVNTIYNSVYPKVKDSSLNPTIRQAAQNVLMLEITTCI